MRLPSLSSYAASVTAARVPPRVDHLCALCSLPPPRLCCPHYPPPPNHTPHVDYPSLPFAVLCSIVSVHATLNSIASSLRVLLFPSSAAWVVASDGACADGVLDEYAHCTVVATDDCQPQCTRRATLAAHRPVSCMQCPGVYQPGYFQGTPNCVPERVTEKDKLSRQRVRARFGNWTLA